MRCGNCPLISNYSVDTSDELKDQLDVIVNKYHSLKDTLVLTVSDKSRITLEKLWQRLKSVNMHLIKGEAHKFWTDHLSSIETHSTIDDDNKGAGWLSSEEQIRNPYVGDKIIKCGRVKFELNLDYKHLVIQRSPPRSASQTHNH